MWGSMILSLALQVVLALPPIAVRMIDVKTTPPWSAEKNHAIRALRYDPIRKIGLLFKCAV